LLVRYIDQHAAPEVHRITFRLCHSISQQRGFPHSGLVIQEYNSPGHFNSRCW